MKYEIEKCIFFKNSEINKINTRWAVWRNIKFSFISNKVGINCLNRLVPKLNAVTSLFMESSIKFFLNF